MKTITAYRCEYCRPGHGRPFASASSCKAHEGRCHDNPNSHSCATCRFKEERREEISEGHSRATWICNANKPGEPLTTCCPSWKQAEEATNERG